MMPLASSRHVVGIRLYDAEAVHPRRSGDVLGVGRHHDAQARRAFRVRTPRHARARARVEGELLPRGPRSVAPALHADGGSRMGGRTVTPRRVRCPLYTRSASASEMRGRTDDGDLRGGRRPQHAVAGAVDPVGGRYRGATRYTTRPPAPVTSGPTGVVAAPGVCGSAARSLGDAEPDDQADTVTGGHAVRRRARQSAGVSGEGCATGAASAAASAASAAAGARSTTTTARARTTVDVCRSRIFSPSRSVRRISTDVRRRGS